VADTFSAYGPTLINMLSQDFGLSPQQAAGIVGQLGHESAGLQAINEKNPLVPGSRGGFGWAQWTGPRRRQFESWAQANNLDVTSPEANYGFLKTELEGPEGKRALPAVQAAPDAISAGRAFTDKFLRPGIPGYASRDKWTNKALGLIGSDAPAGFSAPDASAAPAVSPMGDIPPPNVPSMRTAPQSVLDAISAGNGATMSQTPSAASILGALGDMGGAAEPEAAPVPQMAPRAPMPQVSLAEIIKNYMASQQV
jgi:hypothetical protein